jgi:hypothetical protein
MQLRMASLLLHIMTNEAAVFRYSPKCNLVADARFSDWSQTWHPHRI